MILKGLIWLGMPIGLVGCQLLLAADRAQCATDADCARSGSLLVCRDAVCIEAAPSPPDAGEDASDVVDRTPWGCLADPPARAIEDRSQSITLRNRFVTFSMFDCQHRRPLAGAEVKLCSQDDVVCSAPIETAMTDCEGYVNLEAAHPGFGGYMMIAAPTRTASDAGTTAWNSATTKCFQALYDQEAAAGLSGERCAIRKDSAGQIMVPLPDDLIPGILTVLPPPTTSADPNGVVPMELAIPLMSSGTLSTMLIIANSSIVEEGAQLMARALNCQGASTSGVAIDVAGGLGPASQVYYMDSQGLASLNQGETSGNGYTGYLNLDPGASGVDVVSVTATRKATNERIGTYTINIRSGYTSYFDMPPLKSEE